LPVAILIRGIVIPATVVTVVVVFLLGGVWDYGWDIVADNAAVENHLRALSIDTDDVQPASDDLVGAGEVELEATLELIDELSLSGSSFDVGDSATLRVLILVGLVAFVVLLKRAVLIAVGTSLLVVGVLGDPETISFVSNQGVVRVQTGSHSFSRELSELQLEHSGVTDGVDWLLGPGRHVYRLVWRVLLPLRVPSCLVDGGFVTIRAPRVVAGGLTLRAITGGSGIATVTAVAAVGTVSTGRVAPVLGEADVRNQRQSGSKFKHLVFIKYQRQSNQLRSPTV